MHTKDNELDKAIQFTRNLFFENPNLGINDAARVIQASCKRSLIKPKISEIRQEVRSKISGAAYKNPVPQELIYEMEHEEKPPFNPPRIKESKEPEPVEPVTAVTTAPEEGKGVGVGNLDKGLAAEGPVADAVKESTTEERKKYLEDWALEHTDASVTKAQQMLRDRFGITLGTSFISQTLKTARQLNRETSQSGLVTPPVELRGPQTVTLKKEKPAMATLATLPDIPNAEPVSVPLETVGDLKSFFLLAKKLGIRKLEFVNGRPEVSFDF